MGRQHADTHATRPVAPALAKRVVEMGRQHADTHATHPVAPALATRVVEMGRQHADTHATRRETRFFLERENAKHACDGRKHGTAPTNMRGGGDAPAGLKRNVALNASFERKLTRHRGACSARR